MLGASEVDGIREEFAKALKAGDGLITLDGLTTVFQDLGDWSHDDVSTIFAEVDRAKSGSINYTDLINWIMRDDDDAAESIAKATAPNGEFMEDSDDDDGEQVNFEKQFENSGLELDMKLSLEELTMVLRRFGLDETEAQLIYAQEEKIRIDSGKDVTAGIKLKHFLEDLSISSKDAESVAHLQKVLAEVKGMSARGEHDEPGSGPTEDLVFLTALDRVCLILDRTDAPPEKALSMVAAGEIVLSKKGRESLLAFNDRPDEFVEKVKECMISPPLLPSTAGQTANREVVHEKVAKLVAQCRAAGTKYTDEEWDMTKDMTNILYVDKTGPGYDCTVAKPAGVKRVTELVKDPVLFKGGVSAGDVVQGQVGTCFMLGAVAAIAANGANAIERIFIDYNLELGIYGVRFNVHGEWTHVVIDDYLPVDQHGRLIYARSSDPREVWVPLLEKAYCKLHTCYEMCDGGRPNEAIFSFCGGASGKLGIGTQHIADPPTYFAVLQSARDQGWLLTTTFQNNQAAQATGAGKCGEDVLATGLVGGHVYSVLKLVEACGNQMVCCRNPWGTGEWQGKWSDKNALGEWTDEMKTATDYSEKNDGKFWMCIQDFVENSRGVEYARVFGPKWKKITQHGRFRTESVKATASWAYTAASEDEISFAKGATIEVETMSAGWWLGNVLGDTSKDGGPKKGYFPCNYVKLCERAVARYDLTATPADTESKKVTVVVMLMQPNAKMARKFFKRKEDGQMYKDITYPKLQLLVADADGQCILKRDGKKRTVSFELTLDAGVPVKVYAFSPEGEGQAFSVRVYVKDGSLELKEVPGAKIEEVTAAMST